MKSINCLHRDINGTQHDISHHLFTRLLKTALIVIHLLNFNLHY